MTELTHKESLSDAEPVAWMSPEILAAIGKHPDGHTVLCGIQTKQRTVPLYAAPQPQRLSKMKLLMVTTAYEQGVGKGIKRVDCNPWKPDTDEHDAWQLGYEEGLDKAPQTQREPLDDDEIVAAWNDNDATYLWDHVNKFARAIEKAHGIGVAK